MIIYYISRTNQNSTIMKNVIYVAFIACAMMLFSCAVPRAGAAFGSERVSSSNSTSDRSSSRSAEATSSSQLSFSETQNITGFYVGVEFEDIDITEKLGVQPEVDFVYFSDWKMFQAPVLIDYEFFEGFKGYFGPNVTLLVDTPSTLDSFGFGLDIGASYEIFENFKLEARYDYGLTDYSNTDFVEVKFSHFQIGAAYRFGK